MPRSSMHRQVAQSGTHRQVCNITTENCGPLRTWQQAKTQTNNTTV